MVLASSGCARKPVAPVTRRIAILRFENLSADGSASWMGRAFSEVIAAELERVPGIRVLDAVTLHAFDRMLGQRPISAPGISTEAASARLAGATRVVYGQFNIRAGKLEAQATIEDPAALNTVQTISVTAPAGDVLSAASSIAKAISPQATPFATRNLAALSAFVRALESSDTTQMEQLGSEAVQADPDFGPPYRLISNARGQRGDAAGALAIVERALERGDRIAPLERARLQLRAAEISGNLSGRENALAEIVKLVPSDASIKRMLGEIAYSRREYKRALESLQQAAELEHANPAILNTLAYAAAYSGDMETAASALRRYQALDPNGANPFDSMGDIYLATGKLAEAEKAYQQAHQKNPNFLAQGSLLKAAFAHLLTGDVPGAEQAANRYFEARKQAGDSILDYRRAQWTWLLGRRKEAYTQMEAFATAKESTPLRDFASTAYAQLSLWSLMLGNRETANQLAGKAIRAASPTARGNGIVANFLSLPPVPASQWAVRAEQQFGGPEQNSIKDFALAHALLVNQDFQAAQLLFRQMWENGSPSSDEGTPVMLAWADLETGKTKEAAPLLKFNPVPNAAGLTPYVSFYLPRLFYLRGMLASREGRTSEAAAEFRKFVILSGDLPLIWGEEKKARQ